MNATDATGDRMMPAVYETLDDKPYESHYLCLETIIEHPVAEVWPHVLNIGGWMTDYRLETIAGVAGQVGHFERVYPPDTTDLSPPHYHLYGIAAVVPHRLIVLEVFPEKGGSYGKTRPWMMFDNIVLVGMETATKLILVMIDVHLGRAAQKESHQDEVATTRLNRYVENLRNLVRSASGR